MEHVLQAGASGSAWPALGGASWAAKATMAVPASPLLQQQTQQQQQQPQAPPPPPDMAKQEWPQLPGAGEEGTPVQPAVAPVAAQLQRRGSTMAAELARAASAPGGGNAAGAKDAAADRAAARGSGNGAVLVVPKKQKQAVLPGARTPKKPSAAAAAGPASPPQPPKAEEGEAPSRGAAHKGKGKHAETAAADAGAHVAGKQPAAETVEQRGAEAGGSKAEDASGAEVKHKGNKAGPPPGFEALNGGTKHANGRPKKVRLHAS